MTHRIDVARGRNIAARGCALAEQRLGYLTQLFETGRWRRYYGELAFLENIREAKTSVDIWRDLQTYEAARDNGAVDISGLGRSGATPPRDEIPRDQVHRLQSRPPQLALERPWPAPAEPPGEVSIVAPEQAPSAPAESAPVLKSPSLDQASEVTFDIAALQDRYPLLRNAM